MCLSLKLSVYLSLWLHFLTLAAHLPERLSILFVHLGSAYLSTILSGHVFAYPFVAYYLILSSLYMPLLCFIIFSLSCSSQCYLPFFHCSHFFFFFFFFSLFSHLYVTGVVSYHIDRAERISSTNTIEHRNVDGTIQVSLHSLRKYDITTRHPLFFYSGPLYSSSIRFLSLAIFFILHSLLSIL